MYAVTAVRPTANTALLTSMAACRVPRLLVYRGEAAAPEAQHKLSTHLLCAHAFAGLCMLIGGVQSAALLMPYTAQACS